MATAIVTPILCGEPWDRKVKKFDTATFVRWEAKEGDWVEQGKVVLVIETDKAVCEYEAEASGFLHILVEEGGKAIVGKTVVGFLADTKQELDRLQNTPAWEL